jgi:hypothetical protein
MLQLVILKHRKETAVMQRTEFIEAVRNHVSCRGQVDIQTIKKPNMTYEGLTIRKIGVPTPVVNLDYLYGKYLLGDATLEECLHLADDILDNTDAGIFPENLADKITSWDWVKSNLFIRLSNEFGTDEVVHRKMADLYLIPCIQVGEEGSVVRVVTPLLELWGVTEDMVFNTAFDNQEKLHPVRIRSLYSIVGVPEMPDMPPVFVVSNTSGILGASAILYDGVADEIREKMNGEDFYVLPSSIHEMIVCPSSPDGDVEDLKEMVTLVNADNVAPQDRLTDSVYKFEESHLVLA